MQVQTTDTDENARTSLLPVPAPPPDAKIPEAKPNQGGVFFRFLRVFCACTALFVLGVSIVGKVAEIREAGVSETVCAELLAVGGSPALGDRISAAAFGNLSMPDRLSAAHAPTVLTTLPRLYYVPKEQIADEIYAERDALEKRLADLYAFDYAKLPAGTYPILPIDLSSSSPTDLKNDTGYAVDMNEIAKAADLLEAETVTGDPLVLIVHTHGTESFSTDGSFCYGEDFNTTRSTNVSENIVAVGEVLAEALNKKGIPTIHCETMHDKESYVAAYDRSAESIRYYLAKYPTIRYVFDVHRDSVIRSDLTKLRPVTLRGGDPCAQLMIIIGSDEKGAGEYDWRSNLVLAEAIEKHLANDTLGVARNLYLRGASYNQQYAEHSLLLEIGSCGNSLAEAENAALAFADAFEKVLRGK